MMLQQRQALSYTSLYRTTSESAVVRLSFKAREKWDKILFNYDFLWDLIYPSLLYNQPQKIYFLE